MWSKITYSAQQVGQHLVQGASVRMQAKIGEKDWESVAADGRIWLHECETGGGLAAVRVVEGFRSARCTPCGGIGGHNQSRVSRIQSTASNSH